jgi:hypothetical protein
LKNQNEHSTYVRKLVDSLTGDNVSFIDFDQLKEWLAEVAPVLDKINQLREEIGLLRPDYISRIGGMVKAIAAVKRHPDERENALIYLETLPSLSAGKLIEEYRRTSARFRDAFPTSLRVGH